MKNKIKLGLAVVLSGNLWAQPANNDCANATPITIDANCAGNIYTNVGATVEAGETPAGCWQTAPDNTVWFTFTTGAAGVYDVTTASSTGAPDTQIKIISGSCAAQTTVACNEDAVDFMAAVTANLTAATTYLVQVDIYSTTTGTFCLEVNTVVPPANDCIFDAIDVTAQINGISSSNLFDCATNTYASAAGKPSGNDVTGDVSTCDGGVMDKRDVWFKFTVDGSTPPAWLSVYQKTGTTPSYHAELYSGTPTGTCSSAIDGLTFVDCSAGHYIDGGGVTLPGTNTTLVEPVMGGARDMGLCTTPIHPRIDVSGLAPGEYYFRVYEGFGGEPTNGQFNLCAESAIATSGTDDRCSGVPLNDPCVGENPLDIHISLPNSGNNGMLGNAAPCTRTDEPQLALAAAGDLRQCSGGGFVTYIGGLNNVINNSAIYCIEVAGDAGCTATGDVSFTNVSYGGTDGNSAQIQIISGQCIGGTAVAAVGSNTPCFDVRPAGGTWAPGPYWIVVDGQDGQLLEYDLNIDITFTGLSCPTIAPCVSILGVDFQGFNAIKLDEQNIQISWETINEVENDYFVVQRTYDGLTFEDINVIDGKGNTSDQVNKYKVIDENARLENDVVYYRIKQIDFNGKRSYSEMKAVKLGGANKLLNRINLLGQEVNENYEGVVIEIYSNGINKRFYQTKL